MNDDKVMISQDNLEEMRWDASRSERSTTSVVITTGIAVGIAVVAGMAVYSDVKDRSDHRDRMAKLDTHNASLQTELAALKARMENL